jgi:uncharacterized membrane protein YeaQ/YmgE (transglycosylase-associated protein family)
MGIAAWIIIGLMGGWLANRLMKGAGLGVFRESLIGVAGALIGGLVTGTLLDIQNLLLSINSASVVVAAVGALALVALIRRFPRNSARL